MAEKEQASFSPIVQQLFVAHKSVADKAFFFAELT